MSTPNITQAEIANSGKLKDIKNYFTADALELINRSETMKNMVCAYQWSGFVAQTPQRPDRLKA